MPGFADVLNRNQRWDVIDFIGARAAGALAGEMGRRSPPPFSPEVPDFRLRSRRRTENASANARNRSGAARAVRAPVAIERLQQLRTAQAPFSKVGLRIVAVGRAAPSEGASERRAAPACVVDVASEVISMLTLFQAGEDGGETELMLDPRSPHPCPLDEGNARRRAVARDIDRHRPPRRADRAGRPHQR